MFLMAQGRQVTKTGPNNATGIVWAIGKIFFCFHVLFILIVIFRQGWGGLGEAATMKIKGVTESEKKTSPQFRCK